MDIQNININLEQLIINIEEGNRSKKKQKGSKSNFDNFINNLDYSQVNKSNQNKIYNILIKYNFLINSGTVNCYFRKFYKYVEKEEYIYLLNLLNEHKDIKNKIINTIVDNIIRVLVLNSNCSLLNYQFISLLFNLIKTHNLFISGNYGYKFMCLIMNFHSKTNNLITPIERQKLMKSLCFIHWYPFEINNISKLSLINTDFSIFFKNRDANVLSYYNVNNYPDYIKKQLKKILYSNESKKTYIFLKKLKDQIKQYKLLEGDKPLLILDGGNIGHHHNCTKPNSLMIEFIFNFIKLPIMNYFNYIIILNEKHKMDFYQFPNTEKLSVFFTPLFVDDDKFILYLLFSYNKSFIISNDNYTNYYSRIKNNLFLQYSWNLIIKSSLIKYDIFKSRYIVLKYPTLIVCQNYKRKTLSFCSKDLKNEINQYSFFLNKLLMT